MRGELDARQVPLRMGIDFARPGLEDRLLRELDASIAGLPVDAGLERLVRAWRESVIVVLATDNIRELRLVFEKARAGDGDAEPQAALLAGEVVALPGQRAASAVAASARSRRAPESVRKFAARTSRFQART